MGGQCSKKIRYHFKEKEKINAARTHTAEHER
jgi:hypothetical protein